MLQSLATRNVSRCRHLANLDALRTTPSRRATTHLPARRVAAKWSPRLLFHHSQNPLSKAYSTRPPGFDEYKASFNFPPASQSIANLSENDIGKPVLLHGYLGPRSDTSKKLSFVPLLSKDLQTSVQIVSSAKSAESNESSAHVKLKSLTQHSAVAVRGTVQLKEKPKEPPAASQIVRKEDVEIKLDELIVLNDFPSDVDLQSESNIPPEQRHLQLRQSKELRDALSFRAKLAKVCHQFFADEQGFTGVETPLLFKSTPEGAREFLVPTRSKGKMYALPQSPQQYKQILMNSGISKYYQLARCFRDEDLRADRQPEFTQVDLEMAFATGQDVMHIVEGLMRHLWSNLLQHELSPASFERVSYHDAMSKYGSDKPDTRIGAEIMRIEHMIPVDLVSKIGPLTAPIVEAFKIPISEEPAKTRDFVTRFMDTPAAVPFNQNPDGQPGIFVYDSRKPLGGLQAFGFEAAEQMGQVLELEEGDLIVIQAREDIPFSGGSTSIGNLRLAFHRAAVADGLLEAQSGWHFLWVNNFPMFSPSEDDGSHLQSTHHPFTAPASESDLELLLTNPAEAIADHYDLVLNGVELGGGSRRIHNAAVQEHVLREVLHMNAATLQGFAPLLEVLRAGCPPHAGFALGFDRLCAAMLGYSSIRDVIAFPKSGSGEDRLLGAPARVSHEQLKPYHLQFKQ